MAVISSTKDFWMHPNGLTFAINYFGNPQLIQTSLLAGAVIIAYRQDVIAYNAAHNFREWKLQAFPTQLSDTCTYYVHVELSRTGNTAMVIYSPVIRDMQGRTLLSGDRVSGTYDDNVSDDSWFIYIGTLSASVDSDGNTVERAWTDGVYTGTLATDQYRMEEASGDWAKMFSLNSVTGLIDILKTISKATINALTVAKEFIFGGKTLTDVAGIDEAGDDSKVNDSTLPTTGYVQKELDALDDHFLIKDDADTEQSVAGSVTFERDVTVAGNQTVGGNQTIGGNQTVEGEQELKGLQTLHGGFQTPNFNNAAGQITGAHLTPDGKLYVSGLKANNFEIDQLIFNVVKAQGGEYVYSTSCEIEICTYVMKDGSQLTPDAFYTLPDHDWQQIANVLITLKEDEFTQYGNPFVVGDIIYGKVNQVQESGKHAVGGECIMHITAVEDNTLNITAQLYQVGEHGLAGNIPPIEDMVIAHRGNKDGVQGRTTSFYLSTITGNLVMLYNVTTPTLSAANYGATFGKLPYDLYVQVLTHYAGLQPEDPAVYAKYLVTENWIQMDHLGQPIKFEVYRGDWRYDVAVSDKPYIVTLSTYDTVTHNGAKWRVVTSNTVTEPRDGYDDWERLTDANITVYALAPSSNIIYIRDAGVVTPSELDVTVKSTTSLGEEIISDQATLVSRNLTVWYTIDGGEERKMLVLGGTKVFVTEDGSSVFVTEAENVTSPLYLEGESIDLASVADNITLYLVENYHDNAPDKATDKASYVIPVVRDGAAPFGIEVTPSALSVPIDAETKATAGVRTFSSLVRLKQGKAYLEDVSEYSMSLLFTFGEETSDYPSQEYHQLIDYTIATDDNGVQYGWNILVESPDGVAIDKQLNRIDISVNHSNAVVATEAIQVVYLERGITGPAGKEGPMLYPCGTWKEGAEYKFTYQLNEDGSYATDSDGKYIILAKPFVYYEQDKNYYVLERDVEEGDSILVTNTEYWKPFTKIKYIFTEVLMANWAKLASAIFNGDYMFSMKGIDRLGNYGDYSAYQEGVDSMFDNIGEGENIHKRLNGNFVPNLFIDFKTGAIKMNKFNEPFIHLPYDPDGYNALQITDSDGNERGFNVSVLPRVTGNDSVYHSLPGAVFMPYGGNIVSPTGDTLYTANWDVDGTNSTVIIQANRAYHEAKNLLRTNIIGDNDPWSLIADYVTVLIADGRYADSRSYRNVSHADGTTSILFNPENESIAPDDSLAFGSHFTVGGRDTQLLFLMPGDIVKLKSCKNENGKIYWFVENYSDFGIIPAHITMLPGSYIGDTGLPVEYNSSYQIGQDYTGGVDYGATYAMASRSMIELFDRTYNVQVEDEGKYIHVVQNEMPTETAMNIQITLEEKIKVEAPV